MTASTEYPRSLYLHGWADLSAEKIVRSAEEEEAAREEGYKKLTEFPHPDDFPNGVVPMPAASEEAKPAAPAAPAKPVAPKPGKGGKAKASAPAAS